VTSDRRVTAYFLAKVLSARPYVTVELCEEVLAAPIRRQRQPDGRWRTWGRVALPGVLGTRILRVVTLPDETLHNAFLDRGFREE
jgi:hypothetical protein